MALFNGKQKYLLVVALLILAGFCTYFSYAFHSVEDTLVREQAWEKQQDVNLLCGIVDKLVEIDAVTGHCYGYEEVLQFAVSYIESSYTSTYAQVFDEDLNPLTPLSPGVGGGQKHNPLNYPDFVEAVKHNESGTLSYWYETAQAGGRYVHICFRWVPTDVAHTSRYLVAVGISKYTITESLDPKVTYGAVALIIVTAFIIVYAILLLMQLGYIYEIREGDKWRGRR